MNAQYRGWVWHLVAVAVVLAEVPRSSADDISRDPAALARQVQIQRTRYGVPHIEAPTIEAVAFGFGYCQAEDHAANIMRGMLAARGELAANFGPDEKQSGDGKNVTSDFFNRQFRVHARAVETYHKLEPDYRDACEGFAAGLNYYSDRHRDRVPAWFPRVSGHDVAAYSLAGIMRFAFNRSDIVSDFLKSQGAARAALDVPRDDVEVGSNMWAFAPSRTQGGRTILMGNPHQAWAPVSTYYEAHLIVPGRFDFYGSTFIGRPILTSGWNASLGWSHTVNYPDLEEIYELDLDPARADCYRFDHDSVPLTRDEVAVRIKAAPAEKTETRVFWHTPLGPVVHRTATKVYVLRSACYENYRAYEQWLWMTQAKDFAEFRRTLEMNQLPMFNICYADRDGNIFYLWNGTVPNLPHPAHKAQAIHAARTADVWTTFHMTGELPQLFNPPGGYVQNCNSPPYLTNLAAPLDPARYPAHFSPNDLSLRTQHSLRLVNNDKKFNLEQVCDLKHSPLMLMAERVKADLIAELRAAGPTSEVQAAIETLEQWDNTVAAESRGGTLFADWAKRHFDGKTDGFAVAWSAAEPTTTPRGLADKPRAVRDFHQALAEVTRRFGRHDVTWGEAHRIRKGEVDLPLSGGAGTMGCFRVLEFRQDDDGKMVANSGDSWVFAVEFTNPPRAYTVVAYSQSDVKGDAHFSDQASLFSAGKMKRAAFTPEEIRAQLVRAYHPGEE